MENIIISKYKFNSNNNRTNDDFSGPRGFNQNDTKLNMNFLIK